MVSLSISESVHQWYFLIILWKMAQAQQILSIILKIFESTGIVARRKVTRGEGPRQQATQQPAGEQDANGSKGAIRQEAIGPR